MRTAFTCNVCTVIQKDENRNALVTITPDCECHLRNTCPDDGSSTDKRKEVLEKIPEVSMDESASATF